MLVVPFDRNMVKATKSNVFVKNLGPNATNKSLYELFKDFGEVFSVRLAQDYKGTSKGYGYVQFRNPDDALRAIKEMNGKEIDGRKLLVDIYKAGERRDRDSQRFTNVFVKNLPADVTTKEALDKIFARFGPRTSVGVFSREFEGKPSYYGFVNFEKPEDAAAAVNEMNEKEIGGSKLFVTRALTRDQREREKIKRKIELRNQSRKFTLHVKSVKNEPLSEALLRQELGPFGEIRSIAIQKTKNPEGVETNTAIGYVVFSRPEDAEKAAAEYRKDGPIVANLLEGKEQRKEKMRQMYTMGRLEYGSMPPFGMRGMGMEPPMRGMPRMPRMPGRGRGRGMAMQRPFQRPQQPRPMMPPPYIMPPGRMPPMAFSMMQPPYPGYMPGAPFGMPGQMGPMGAMPGGVPGGMPTGLTAGVPMPPMMGPQFMQPPMMPQQPPAAQPLPTDKEELGERLYPKIEHLIDPAYQSEVSKITGMLLDLPVEEIIGLINDEEKLRGRIDEALKLLREKTE